MRRTRSPWPLWTLEEAARRPPRELGGKALGLVRLVEAGLPVPPALVVPGPTFEAFLAGAGLLDRARKGGDAELPDAIRGASLDPDFAARLRAAAARLGPRLAVRSSAAEEDGVHHSFAGQLRTVLGVAPGEALEEALKDCWASAYEATVEAYRGHRGQSQSQSQGLGTMAVVVQAMVDARCAGVLFTINPMTGSWREMTVEAAWGLGEAVVSGRVVPDFYRVRRPRRAPSPVQRVLARIRLEVIEQRVRAQDTRWVQGPTGAQAEPVPLDRREAPKLDRASLLRLCRMGLRIEASLGGPQDIEWAMDSQGRLQVLQARPVTAAGNDQRQGTVVWTRRFVGERWTGPASPLGWSLMRDTLHWFIAYPEVSKRYLGGEEPTRLVRFAPYLNVTVFRHLAFKAPGAAPPRFMVELLPPDEEQGWLRRRAHPPDLRVYSAIIATTLAERRWRRFRWNPLTNWKAWEEWLAELDRALPAMQEPLVDRAQARARLEACEALAQGYIKVHICSLLFANIWFQAADAVLAAQDRSELVPVLLRPPADTWTARTNQALWSLGRGELELDAFLADFGHRSSSSWELSAPRWAEDIDQVMAMARASARQDDPRLRAEAARLAADQALHALPRGAARSLVVLARRYLLLREDQRFHFDRLLWTWKRTWAWLAEDLGLDVWCLEHTEVKAVMDGQLEVGKARQLAARRRAELEAEVARRAQGEEPPVFLVGDQAVEIGNTGGRLQGLGISPGVATGTARVLSSPAEAERLQPGDILVAHATDPGWTPLFLSAGAVVMELGGMLSHGAVVAREYGLPAVVNVVGATEVLIDGQTITVDGNRGVVWVR